MRREEREWQVAVKVWLAGEAEPPDGHGHTTKAPPHWFEEDPRYAAELYGLEKGPGDYRVRIRDNRGALLEFQVSVGHVPQATVRDPVVLEEADPVSKNVEDRDCLQTLAQLSNELEAVERALQAELRLDPQGVRDQLRKRALEESLPETPLVSKWHELLAVHDDWIAWNERHPLRVYQIGEVIHVGGRNSLCCELEACTVCGARWHLIGRVGLLAITSCEQCDRKDWRIESLDSEFARNHAEQILCAVTSPEKRLAFFLGEHRNLEIELWFGAGDFQIVGPLEARILRVEENGLLRALITDKDWLARMGREEPLDVLAGRLPANRAVWYDDYAWCPKGERT